MLVEAFGEHALSRRFDEGNFDISNDARGRPQEKFKDDELEALLAEDNTQT